MPIRWSALKVSEVMDEVEQQLNLARAFLAEAQANAQKATQIPRLPEYMLYRIGRLRDAITDGRSRMRNAVGSVRQAIPEGELEADRSRGSQHELTL